MMKLLLLAACAFPWAVQAEEKVLKYPATRKVDVVEDYHGTKVSDPYRWLEDDVRVNPDVAAWVEEQNKITQAFLDGIPERAKIRQRLTELWNYEKYSAPRKVGNLYFFSKNDGLQNQSVLYVQTALDGEPRMLLDPNSWSTDGTIALVGFVPSDDGKLAAFGKSAAGSDWSTWYVMDVATGQVLPDEIHWIKYSSVSWSKDGQGFYYSRFPEPNKDAAFQAPNTHQKLYYHKLGTPQSEDPVVYELPEQPKWGINAGVTDDGRFLVISISDGTTSRKNRVAIKDLTQPNSKIEEIISNHEDKYSFIDNVGTVFYVKTEWRAPRGQVIAIDLTQPRPENWKIIVPETKDTLLSASIVGDLLFCEYLQDAKSLIKVHDLSGQHVRDVALPGIGTAGGFEGKRTDTETFYVFSSFATPPSIFRYDTQTGASTLLRQAKVKFNPDDYEVHQRFYSSKDGTRVPMFICHKKGIKLDGTNPCLLYGYGGFNIPLTPSFSVGRLQWMEMGGVYAMPNLRGGGEYGDAWHRAGTKLNKQNVFDDFIAAAEFLIQEGYTSPRKLAIHGGSNGGLLVGACMVQRPDLFAAAIPAVGVMDMLRFQQYTAGRFWVDDYGSSDDPEEFKALYAYSPYHNLKPGVKYPATLVTTADTDDRVVPGHSFKFIARLQEYHAGNAPVLARIETKAGHGAGKPTTKLIDEVTDMWAFLVKTLAVPVSMP